MPNEPLTTEELRTMLDVLPDLLCKVHVEHPGVLRTSITSLSGYSGWVKINKAKVKVLEIVADLGGRPVADFAPENKLENGLTNRVGGRLFTGFEPLGNIRAEVGFSSRDCEPASPVYRIGASNLINEKKRKGVPLIVSSTEEIFQYVMYLRLENLRIPELNYNCEAK